MNRFHYLNEVYEAPIQSGVINFLSSSKISKSKRHDYRDLDAGLNMNKVLQCAYNSNEGKSNIMH